MPLAISWQKAYDEMAAGGVEGPPVPANIRRGCKRHDNWACGLCAEAVNHGDKSPGREARYTKAQAKREAGKKKGLAFRATWYERQTKTLERLRKKDEYVLGRHLHRDVGSQFRPR